MVIGWLVIAAILYFPFKKWAATYQAPFIAALLWPVMVVIMVIMLFFGLISRLKGKN